MMIIPPNTAEVMENPMNTPAWRKRHEPIRLVKIVVFNLLLLVTNNNFLLFAYDSFYVRSPENGEYKLLKGRDMINTMT